MEERKDGQPVKDQAVKQQEDEDDLIVLEVHKTESVGSSGQLS